MHLVSKGHGKNGNLRKYDQAFEKNVVKEIETHTFKK